MSVVSSASELASVVEAHDVAVLDAYTSSEDQSRRGKVGEYARSVGVVVPSGYKGRKDLVDGLGLRTSSNLTDSQADVAVNKTTWESTTHTADSDSKGLVVTSAPEASEAAPGPNVDANTESINTAKRRFFIHRPEISPAQKQVVIPVDGTLNLRDILRGKTVREFPTFLVEVSGSDQIDWTRWHLKGKDDWSEIVQT